MNSHVFISYSSNDKQTAIALCNYLESHNINCWMAPRNIIVGKDYAQSIIEAIEASAIMILILTNAANNSKHVRNEIERAFNHQLVIMPFRIENITPGKSLEYFLSATHWLDAYNDKPEKYFKLLLDNCKSVFQNDISKTDNNVKEESEILTAEKSNFSKTKILQYSIIGIICFSIALLFLLNHGNTTNTLNSQKLPSSIKADSVKVTDTAVIKNDSIRSPKNNEQTKSKGIKINQPANGNSNNITEKINSIPDKIVDEITGIYWKPDGADELTFSGTGNNLMVHGRITGIQISAQLSANGTNNFKLISETVSGTLYFENSFETVRGTLKSSSVSRFMQINLIKKTPDY